MLIAPACFTKTSCRSSHYLDAGRDWVAVFFVFLCVFEQKTLMPVLQTPPNVSNLGWGMSL